MDLKRIIGQCAPLFFLAVTLDLVGFVVMLVGLAASPRIGERVYGDFLALTGAVLMFFGLGMWVLWYAGNIGADGKRTGFGRIARTLTERSGKYREEEGEEEEEEVEEHELEEEEVKKRRVEEEEVEEHELEEEEVKKRGVEEDEVDKREVEEDEVDKREVAEEEQYEGKSEKDDAGYINEAYEPTESETI